MACINSTTFYWPGASFASTPTIYSDPGFTTIAPDGWYQQGGIFRQMSGGVLGAATTCPACVIPCDSTVTGSGGTGKYLATASIGSSVGVVLIRFNAFSVPDRCTWSYDYDNSGTPTVASEYSSNTYGYMSGLIGTGGGIGSYSCVTMDGSTINVSNAAGSGGTSFAGNIYNYDFATNSFVNSGTATTVGPYTDQASGGVTLVNGMTGWCMMVVPKPLGLPATLDVVVDGPCQSTQWQIFISCPTQLNNFKCSPSPTPACTGTSNPFFTAHPGNTAGTAAAVFVGDWAFEDEFGVTKKAAGTYLVETGGAPQCVVVSSNGVVTTANNCVGNC